MLVRVELFVKVESNTVYEVMDCASVVDRTSISCLTKFN